MWSSTRSRLQAGGSRQERDCVIVYAPNLTGTAQLKPGILPQKAGPRDIFINNLRVDKSLSRSSRQRRLTPISARIWRAISVAESVYLSRLLVSNQGLGF